MAKAKKPKPECISVGSKIRELYPIIDETTDSAKKEAIRERRKKLWKTGRKLSERRRKQVSDALERVQRKLNPLELRRERLVKVLLADYGHEQYNEIIGKLGNTLITERFELAIEDYPRLLLSDKLTPAQRKLISRSILVVDAAFAAAKAQGGEELQKLLLGSLKVKKCVLSVIPPSSRTPKAGDLKEDPEENGE